MNITIQVNDKRTFIVYEHRGEYRIEEIQRPDNDDHTIKIAKTVKEALSTVIDICEKAGEN